MTVALVACVLLGSCAHRICLPASDISTQLNELSMQTDIQILYNFNYVHGWIIEYCPSKPVSIHKALDAIVKHKNVYWDWVNSRTIIVTASAPLCSPNKGALAVIPPCRKSI